MNALLGKRIAVIGAGNIGRILLERLTFGGVPIANLILCDADAVRAERASRRFGPQTCSLTDDALYASDIYLLATPPKVIFEVLETLGQRLRPGQLVISFAVAIRMSRLEALVPAGVSVVRVMPNAPSLVGKGMNPVAYSANVSAEAGKLVKTILQTLGRTIEARDDQMNWCVGLTGAAMRSLLPTLVGMTQAGVEAGFAEKESRHMAAQVMLGTAALVLESDLTFDEIKALTPMETVDEVNLQKIFADAARTAKEKMDRLQQRLEVA